MKKHNRTWMFTLITLSTVFFLLASSVWADPKFTVEDGVGNPVFTVHNDGNVLGTGFLGLGDVTTPKAVFHSKGSDTFASQLLLTREETNNNAGAGFVAYHNNANYGMPATNDRLGYFLFGSYFEDTTNKYGAGAGWLWARNGAGISAKADGPWSDSSIPAYFSFETASSGSISRSERLRIGSDGVITVNNLAGTYSGGSAYVCVNNSGQIYASESACP